MNAEKSQLLEKLIEIGQLKYKEEHPPALLALLEQLIPVDFFYREIGGIVGYQKKIAELLYSAKEKETSRYHPPVFVNIAEETEEVWKLIFAGIEALPHVAEMVPLGGAADRLHLVDEKTGGELPAAKLQFAGLPLLALIIRDIQAREYLYYKLYGKQLITPIAFMTSQEKDNHRHVQELMEEANWFGRPKESFKFFKQPLVPVVRQGGDWCWVAPYKPLMKPGGHGAIWKLARDLGIFQWFKELQRTKGLIRQINNPIAGLDYGILAFAGVGVSQNKLFGFASCPRLPNTAEGVNVIVERSGKIVLTNVEYCDFTKAQIADRIEQFPSNTNILFADLNALEKAVEQCPYPGLLINMKKISYTTSSGEIKEESLARLESTMQNIADVFVEEKKGHLQTERTFVTYNHRHKTMSTAKKAYVPGHLLQETPEMCFYDLLQAHRELLDRCRWALPLCRTLEESLTLGPDCLFLYHPALGPLYSLIAQKLRGGSLALGSEMQLEIADLDAENLHIQGSLCVTAQNVMGDSLYSDRTGRCILKNVRVSNRGVDWSLSTPFWKNALHRSESLEILLQGRSAFIAQDIHFTGSHRFVVEDGISLRVYQEQGQLKYERTPLASCPLWLYEKSDKIILKQAASDPRRADD